MFIILKFFMFSNNKYMNNIKIIRMNKKINFIYINLNEYYIFYLNI